VKRWQIGPAASIIAGTMRLLGATLRWKIEDQSGLTHSPPTAPAIAVCWHNRILLLPLIYERLGRPVPTLSLTSASRDGELAARLLSRFGLQTTRGSSSKRGVAALKSLHEALADKRVVIMIPDGPRGPRYHLQPGVVHLAMTTGAPVFVMSYEPERYWRLKSWDGFLIPKPFSTVHVTLTKPIPMQGDRHQSGEVEKNQTQLLEEMMKLVKTR